MWVSDALAGRVKGISIFLGIAALATILLYVLSYEEGVNRANQKDTASTTAILSSLETDSALTATIKTDTKATSSLKTMSGWKSTMTTLFWVGESADADNAYITNTASYWDEEWQDHFGGVDSPNCRKGYLPCDFQPKENPFYFALPYAEYDASGKLKATAKKVPWFGKDSRQLLKNRWIVVRNAGRTCYAQWEDVGPNGEDDFAYVFGSSKPVNTFGEKAGLDASPALWKCLQMSDNGVTDWAFVEASEVPAGPWKDIVTTSGTSWGN